MLDNAGLITRDISIHVQKLIWVSSPCLYYITVDCQLSSINLSVAIIKGKPEAEECIVIKNVVHSMSYRVNKDGLIF